MRSTTLSNKTSLAIDREIESRYDAVVEVSKHLDAIDTLAATDLQAAIDSLNEAKDFTGITVVSGDVASWDAVNKVLTVTTEKGETGSNGRGIVSIDLTTTAGVEKTYTITYTDNTTSVFTVSNGTNGVNGVAGKSTYQLWLDAGNEGTLNDFLVAMRGPTGPTGPTGIGLQGAKGDAGEDLTIEQIVYNSDGTFTWHFSDETTYTTPNLKGDKGDKGDIGLTGLQGISVHHLKATSTTDPEGDFGTFGELDTYTLYGDASETINLGHFTVRNGITPETVEGLGVMRRSTYDANDNGIVDNSERLEGRLAAEFVNVEDAQDIGGTKTFTGDVVIQGNLAIHGAETVVNSETVTTKDNQIVINEGEVGAGVTAGKAGIKVDRGTETDYEFVFVEADDSFKIGKEGELQKVATREDTPIDTGLATWDASTSKFVTSRNVDVDSVSLGNGVLTWNPDEGTLDIDTGTGVVIQAGQENNRVVRNGTGSTIVNGTVVMVTGTIGNSGRLVVAPASGVVGTAMRVYGVATQDILAGQDGYITIDGKVRGINTTGSTVGEVWVDEDVLYIKPNDAGNLTKVVPTYGQLKMPVAKVVHAHTSGTLEVRITPIDENAYEPSNSNIQGHIVDRSNPHGVTKTQVGLGNVDNTADVDKNVLSATKWTTARTITLSGDVSGLASVDGSANVTITTTVQPNSVSLGTDTTGNYMVNVTAGGGISVSHTQGEGSTATITNSAPNVTTNITTTHTSTNVVVNSSDGTDGTINSATQTLAGVMSATDKTKLDGIEAGATGDQTASEILTLLKTVDGSGSGLEAETATKLATARTIALTGDVTGNVNFDGSGDVSITTTVADDSHNHVISNVDGLQNALDTKAPLANPAFTGTPKIGTDNITSISTTVTDNAIARYDGTTGKLQNSGVTIDDSGNITASTISSTTGGSEAFSIKYTEEQKVNVLSSARSTSAWSVGFGVKPSSTTAGEFISTVDNTVWTRGALLVDDTLKFLKAPTQNTAVGSTVSMTEVFRTTTAGDLLLTSGTGALGYGTGSGGSVTQLTSKSTAVTLNKPCGQIIMHNAELAAGARITFTLNNSLLTAGSIVVLALGLTASYKHSVDVVYGGSCVISIENKSLSSRSDALPISFAIINGSLS